MFIETRTTHTEVIADVLKEVDRQANSVINQVWSFERHPTMNTKTNIRQELFVLYGMATLARRVKGTELPEELEAKLDKAVDAVASLKA